MGQRRNGESGKSVLMEAHMLFCARTYHHDHLRYHQEPSRTPKRHTNPLFSPVFSPVFSLLCSNTRNLSTTVFPTPSNFLGKK